MNRKMIAKELVKIAKSLVASKKHTYSIHLSVNLGDLVMVEADTENEAIEKAIAESKNWKVSECNYEETHVDSIENLDDKKEDE